MESFRETSHEEFSSENSEGIKFPLEIKFGLDFQIGNLDWKFEFGLKIETKERSL
jgi:hypothetical protein